MQIPNKTAPLLAAILAKRKSGAPQKDSGGGLNAPMTLGQQQAQGQSFFSTTPGLGHALSGSLGKADRTTRHAGKKLARFAEGGGVKKPFGPNAKDRKQIRDMIERGKDDAVSTLRDTRAQLMSSVPPEPADIDSSLDELRGRLAMKDGGEVDPAQAGPQALYQQYMQLMEKLHDPQLDQQSQMQLIDQLTQIESVLQAMGIPVGDDGAPEAEPASAAPQE